jgi:hypothetical protein
VSFFYEVDYSSCYYPAVMKDDCADVAHYLSAEAGISRCCGAGVLTVDKAQSRRTIDV